MATMRKTEDHHHSYDQVVGYVEQAKRAAIATKLPDDVVVRLMPTLVTLLSSKQVFYEQAAPLPAFDLGKLRGH